jgi:hypothetical protein
MSQTYSNISTSVDKGGPQRNLSNISSGEWKANMLVLVSYTRPLFAGELWQTM